jgi:hypothetical protein
MVKIPKGRRERLLRQESRSLATTTIYSGVRNRIARYDVTWNIDPCSLAGGSHIMIRNPKIKSSTVIGSSDLFAKTVC